MSHEQKLCIAKAALTCWTEVAKAEPEDAKVQGFVAELHDLVRRLEREVAA